MTVVPLSWYIWVADDALQPAHGAGQSPTPTLHGRLAHSRPMVAGEGNTRQCIVRVMAPASSSLLFLPYAGPEQRTRLKPALVWAEICSYIKGSAEAMASERGHLDPQAYIRLGAKRAANFTSEMREKDVWPIFVAYQRAKRLRGRCVLAHCCMEMHVESDNGPLVM